MPVSIAQATLGDLPGHSHSETFLTLFGTLLALPSTHPGLPTVIPAPKGPSPSHVLPTHEFAHLVNLASERTEGT